MSKSLDKFVDLLLRAELITKEQLQAVHSQLESDGQTTVEDNLALRLADSGHLTDFQADEIRQGKVEHLMVGDYLILQPIGRGGMGQVFKARHCMMKREVAVKFTLPDNDGKVDPASADRFQREVEAASKLSHPNIVSSLDAGREGDVCYLVMEYVRGTNLAHYVRENGPMSFRQALDCTLQAAQGLEYAHSQGVVHRDIKPSNLLLTTDGKVKVLDMGLARTYEDPIQREESEDPLTHSGQLLGSVDFMAPEQAVDPRRCDGRADIYSLGCTLYYLLTGSLPFRRDGGTTMSRIIAHRESPIPSICRGRVDVPRSFEGVFQKMLAKQVHHRYQTVAELILDLRKVQLEVASRGDAAETETVPNQAVARPARWRWVAAGLAVVALLSAAGVYWAVTSGRNQGISANGDSHGGGGEHPVPAAGPVDLLQSIDLTKHVIAGSGWDLSGGKLHVPDSVPSKLHVPAALPPAFRLALTVTRTAGTGPLIVGVNDQGRRFYLLIDAERNEGEARVTALGTTKSGRLIAPQEDALLLEPQQPVALLLLVESDQISLQAESSTVLQWQGDVRELTLGGGWGIGNARGLLIGSNNQGAFEISNLQLTPDS